MHPTSYEKMAAMVRVHLEPYRGVPLEVLDFGSQMVDDQQESYRDLIDDPAWHYRGLDIEPGRNVDVCVADAYRWLEVPSDTVDLVISGQALEHVEFFWASLFEVARVLRPGGVTTIIAPSGGVEHRFPVDCWRFYRDGFSALARYVGLDVIDVDTDWGNGMWEDSILVARKPVWNAEQRAVFAERARLQQHLVADLTSEPGASGGTEAPEQPAPTPTTQAAHTGDHSGDHSGDELPAPSPLAGITPGALTAELAAMREARTAQQPNPEPPAGPTSAPGPEVTIDATVTAAPPTLAQRGRALLARAAGQRGRRAYRRLRSRRIGPDTN